MGQRKGFIRRLTSWRRLSTATLTTHGIEKEEILKMANSIDLTGL